MRFVRTRRFEKGEDGDGNEGQDCFDDDEENIKQ
jgi:hypothetical protein